MFRALALGLLLAAPLRAAEEVVWQIGEPDGSYAEMAIARDYHAYEARFLGKPPVIEWMLLKAFGVNRGAFELYPATLSRNSIIWAVSSAVSGRSTYRKAIRSSKLGMDSIFGRNPG